METSSNFRVARQNLSWASSYWYMPGQTRGYGFIEFEISSSTISILFRQPLSLQAVAGPGLTREGETLDTRALPPGKGVSNKSKVFLKL